MSSVNLIARTTRCPMCQFRNERVYRFDYATFRHLDFAQQPTTDDFPNVVCACSDCGVIYRVGRWEEISLVDQFTTDEYAAHQEDHQVRDQSGVLRDAAEVQADLIAQHLEAIPEQAAVLDIGCFDGKLLGALKYRTGAVRLTGYDVAPRSSFPQEQGFEFVENLDEVDGRYALIILSHSLIYIEDVKGLFDRIDQLLAEDGVLFVHVPNVDVRPSTLLLGDQLYYFGKEALGNLLLSCGFSIEFIGERLFPKDILVVASKKSSEEIDVSQEWESDKVIVALNKLEMATYAAVNDQQQVVVLGTTIEAAFVNSLISKRVSFFVDENKRKQEVGFCGKKVLAPGELKECDVCIIPMGKQSQDIARRLSVMSVCQFIVL
ncbi:MAG: class I SAM-dependent methyltransferase [Gammaproteobacteria bacterium]|nr:class I SAM-dependent methyltransferase [Gammaproteobacteria bacterium]